MFGQVKVLIRWEGNTKFISNTGLLLDFVSKFWLGLAEVSLAELRPWLFFAFSPLSRLLHNEDSRFSLKFTFVFLISPRRCSVSLRPAFEREWGRKELGGGEEA